MRVAVDMTPQYRDFAGMGRVCRDFLNAFSNHREVEIFQYSFGDYFRRSNYDPQVKRVRYPIPQTVLNNLWNKGILKVDSMLRQDIFQSFSYYTPATRTAKKVTCIHDVYWKYFPDAMVPGTLDMMKGYVNSSMNKAHIITVPSTCTKIDLLELYGAQHETKIVVVPWGINERFSHFVKPAKKKSEITKFLFVGTLEPRKNLSGLIEALALLEFQFKLDIVGMKARDTENIANSLKRLGIEDAVTIHGFVNDDVLKTMYQEADFFLFPSLYEGFGFPVVEALALGCPVVCSNTGSLPEIGGDLCTYFDPSDVSNMASKITEARKSGVNVNRNLSGSVLVREKFTWAKTVGGYLDIYKKLLAD